ncbi:MAG: ribosome maturation factor RimM, partial [Acidimicrobiia bacterium]
MADLNRVLVGRISRAHGTRGAVVVEPHTDDPASRFAPGRVVFLADGVPLTIRRYEATDRSPVVTFDGIEDRTQAEALRGSELYIPAGQRRPLGEHEFWPDELVGLSVVTVEGTRLGTVTAVETGLSQDRLTVDTPQGAIIVPLVKVLVPTVD